MRRHWILIGMCIWLAVAVVIGALGIPRELQPPTPQIIVGVLTLLLVLVSLIHGPLRSWVMSCDWRALVEIHLIRAVAGVGFLLAGAHGRFPEQFAKMAGYGDIGVAVLGLLLILFVSPHLAIAPWLYGIWNTLGLLDILHVVIDAGHRATANPASMMEILVPPFVLLPLFVVPILIASHIWLYERVFRRQ